MTLTSISSDLIPRLTCSQDHQDDKLIVDVGDSLVRADGAIALDTNSNIPMPFIMEARFMIPCF